MTTVCCRYDPVLGNAIKGNLMRKQTKGHSSHSEGKSAGHSEAGQTAAALTDADIANHREFHDHDDTEVNSRIYVKVTIGLGYIFGSI